jgi:hypothetical protein
MIREVNDQNTNCATSWPVRGGASNVEVLIEPKPETSWRPMEQGPFPPVGNLQTGAICGFEVALIAGLFSTCG